MEGSIEDPLQGAAKHCDKVVAGLQVGAVPIGFPVAKRVAPTLRYWVRRYISEAKFEADMKKYAVKTQCTSKSAGPAGGTSTEPGVFAGPFAVLLVSVACAIVWALWASHQRHRRKKAFETSRATMQVSC